MPAHVLIVYVGPSEAVDVNGVTFQRGVPQQVDKPLAASLLEQECFTAAKPRPERAIKTAPETRGQNKRSD